MAELWAVRGDPNTDGAGGLIATNPQTVFINGIPVIRHLDHAEPDDVCPAPLHCDPYTDTYAPSTFVYSTPAHRNNDLRICTAKTVVTNQGTVYVGDLSVSNGSAVVIDGILVPTDPESPAATAAIRNQVGRAAPGDDDGGSDGAPDGGGSNPAYAANQSRTDTVTGEAQKESNDKPPAKNPEVQKVDTTGLNNNIDYNEKISTNYTVGDLTIRTVFKCRLQPNKGLSVAQIKGNLKAVAVNCLEPVRAQFPTPRVNSGFRNKQNNSQHNKGMAVDLQWPGWSYDDYWKNAQWIKDNIMYDQFLYEYGRKVWIHLSFDPNKSQQRRQVKTMYAGTFYTGLKRFR